jgi:hypothetical protein
MLYTVRALFYSRFYVMNTIQDVDLTVLLGQCAKIDIGGIIGVANAKAVRVRIRHLFYAYKSFRSLLAFVISSESGHRIPNFDLFLCEIDELLTTSSMISNDPFRFGHMSSSALTALSLLLQVK